MARVTPQQQRERALMGAISRCVSERELATDAEVAGFLGMEPYGKHDERKHKWHNIFVGYCDDGNWLTSYCFGCEYISKVNDDFEARNDKSRVKVTHWMPLPDPPQNVTE